jgi:hypothetical protein
MFFCGICNVYAFADRNNDQYAIKATNNMRIEPAKYGAFIPINPNATPAIAGPTIRDMVVVERVTPIIPP